jgi:hypothetical protein
MSFRNAPDSGAFFLFKRVVIRIKKTLGNRRITIGELKICCIFVTVFHRILDFKNGAGFLSGPHFFLVGSRQSGV